ncbi:MAG: EF-P beta-lysylation protein EpmB [Pseudomonadota bacterium]|jgi:lysine-2,3-aminomutase-related protein|nr:MAG: EF-P beta-lysylation protein EpmB [Pseudomonadota bacterium]
MIPASSRTDQTPDSSPRRTDSGIATRWQRELAEAVKSPRELVAALGLDPAVLPGALAADEVFRLRVPWSYVRRMRRGDPADPLLRQVLPVARELDEHPGYTGDPLGERAALRAPGLLHKYHGRVLLVTTPACAVHCRYCFRREFPYAEQTAGAPRWNEALEVIRNDASIEEVILSGGDPLSLSDARLAQLTDALARIPHVRRLRVHTRTPIVLPSRVDEGLERWLSRLPWPVVLVLHANHPNEIDADVRSACGRLRATGATLLNQSVLLAGVNDDAEVLAELSRRLFDCGVLPYYLHLLDRVRGAAHFEVDEERARRIAGELAASLPGYLVPRLAREVYGAPAKLSIAPIMP